MAIDGVRRDEEAFGDLSIRQPFSDEARDVELCRRQRRPTIRLGFGGDEAPPNAELAEAAADTAGIPNRAELGEEGQATSENLDCGLAVGRDQFDAHVFEGGPQLEPSRSALEEIDRLTEQDVASLEKTADMGCGCRDRGDAGVQLRSAP